jgi:hypothetical protein
VDLLSVEKDITQSACLHQKLSKTSNKLKLGQGSHSVSCNKKLALLEHPFLELKNKPYTILMVIHHSKDVLASLQIN